MLNIENNTMSTFTIGGKTFEIEDTSARSNIQTITSDMSNYYTKFEIDNLINNIDGGDNSGLSNTAKNLLLTILKATVTNSDQASNIAALEIELNSGGSDTPTITNYTITNTLINCSNSNNTSTIQENSSYTATIIANSDYTLNSVTVTMGGIDITSTVYNNGAISISAVTGNIVITASATENVQPQSEELTSYMWGSASLLTIGERNSDGSYTIAFENTASEDFDTATSKAFVAVLPKNLKGGVVTINIPETASGTLVTGLAAISDKDNLTCVAHYDGTQWVNSTSSTSPSTWKGSLNVTETTSFNIPDNCYPILIMRSSSFKVGTITGLTTIHNGTVTITHTT